MLCNYKIVVKIFAVVAVAPDLEGILGKIEQLIFFHWKTFASTTIEAK